MGLTNDERGWIMTLLSGIACVVGASVICVDIIIRKFPGKKHFRIQDSDAFLSASLSLSFGVMLFSSLYSMLPSSKRALQDGGFSPKEASWIMIVCFLAGVIGIQIISKWIHHFMPSHVVDCEHTHDEEAAKGVGHDDHDHSHEHGHEHDHVSTHDHATHSHTYEHGHHGEDDGMVQSKATPAIPLPAGNSTTPKSTLTVPEHRSPSRRPSLKEMFRTSVSQLIPKKEMHDKCDNPCFGFTEPCGAECFKNVNARGGFKVGAQGRPSVTSRSSVQSLHRANESTPLLQSSKPATGAVTLQPPDIHRHNDHQHSSASSSTIDANNEPQLQKVQTNESSKNPDHHHHVPANAFLSIGLQTSIAIALHKLPEGFITFATNHANPKLGFSVFLALFIHNITEGFALALPLYLALNNRLKAMLISFVLGGLSQPMGAGVAALWFKIAGQGDWAPSEGVYGGMFAVTAGIMASVALQLFSESLDLTHSRTLCMVGAFTGMGILGISSALTA